MENKKVSFVVPVYKTEAYLEKCLKSLLNQDYKNIEIVVVLDGPSAEARKIISGMKDKRIVMVLEIEHGGANKARNAGYPLTTGDYVSFWDSDCYAEIGMARMWVKSFATSPDVDFVYSGYRFNTPHLDFMASEPFNSYLITCNNYIATMFPMKREIFPGFDESLKSLQDWDMWLTIIEKGHKGFWLDGSAFITEVREGISSEGCSQENWLERYNRVREKHGIKDRNICFTSMTSRFRGMELAQMFKQDYKDYPGFHPNEYKMIYCIGFYPDSAVEASKAFKNAPKDCVKIIHWTGEDAEQWLMQPYKGVKHFIEVLGKTVHKHYVENHVSQEILKELGIESEIMPLPMNVKEVENPEQFRVYYEWDNVTKPFVDEIIKSCPDITFESGDVCNLKDYACFFSITNSAVPSENLKRFLASGRLAVTNYRLPYAGYVEPEREAVVRKLREAKQDWKNQHIDLRGVEYWRNVIDPKAFSEKVVAHV
jgi:glycosyltransferase involved in cell wall biosynthesis